MENLEKLEVPNGWLIDPKNKWAIHFDFKNLSNNPIETDFTIDMWGVFSNGKPMEFKSRRKATKNESIKTWNQLVESNWVEFDLGKHKTS